MTIVTKKNIRLYARKNRTTVKLAKYFLEEQEKNNKTELEIFRYKGYCPFVQVYFLLNSKVPVCNKFNQTIPGPKVRLL